MANEEQLSILKQGIGVWNKWREENPSIKINLEGAYLSGAVLGELKIDPSLHKISREGANLRKANLENAYLSGARFHYADLRETNLRRANLENAYLSGVDLSQADLREANLSYADLFEANLREVNLSNAKLSNAHLVKANLSKANLSKANFWDAKLMGANLSEANLDQSSLSGTDLTEVDFSGANLFRAQVIDANLSRAKLIQVSMVGTVLINTVIEGAILSRSYVYGSSAWDLKGEFGEQKDLAITRSRDPIVTVDNIKIAQFIYLILDNEEIRDVINTLTSKSVLILGRFSIPERKAILNTLKNKLREYDLLPIVFDFDRPADKDFTETIKTLASISFFVIADVTNPKSSPLELQATVPDYQIPFVPIIQEGESPFAMMVDLQKKYNWVLPTVTYDLIETLIKILKPLIIDPAMIKRQELRVIKAQEPEVISGKDFLKKGKV